MANSNLEKEEVAVLVQSICEEHGLDDQSCINFDDFCRILSPQMDTLSNGSLEWKGNFSTCFKLIIFFLRIDHMKIPGSLILCPCATWTLYDKILLTKAKYVCTYYHNFYQTGELAKVD